ncbi:TonB-dependent receptor [Henriciella sp.]|uniref:TonB-dependent receptor domain-containing protein n=1 Tax=Henriciella sp. TaxID=1968823 RepID=UPI00261A3595|nr:TonB-dependent receptor [Henriciella sp.]
MSHAQDEASKQRIEETIIVVGETTNVLIDDEQIEKTQANDLADIFRQTPSVSVGGSVGIAQKVYVRGLEDTLLNVTVDGAPQTGTLFHHIGRVHIEPELLERVELQAGAGEATAGFGAVGGAIRFRTKSASDLLKPDERFGAMVRAGWFSNDGYKGSATAYGKLSDNWDLLGSLVYVDRENMEDGDGNTLYGTAAEQLLGFVKLSGEIAPDHFVSLSYENRDEEGEFGARPNWPTLESDTLFPAEATRETVVANYRNELGDFINVDATAYFTSSEFEQDRFDRWGRYGGDLETYGFDLRNTSRFGEHELIYGVEHRNDTVSSQYLAPDDVWQAWAWDPAIGQFEEEGNLWAGYLQGHFQVTDKLLLSAGGRYDSYELELVTYNEETSSDGFSGNIGLRYDFTPELAVTVGHAQAFRGKEVGDSFTLEKRPGRLRLDPGLDPERVDNTEAGLVYDNGRLRAGASVFSMTIDDVILDQIGGGAAPQDSIYYENVGEFETQGVELRAGYSWDRFSADLFYTTYDSELNGRDVEGYEEIGLANASGDQWNLNLAWTPTHTFDLGLNVRKVEDLNDITVLYRALEIGWTDRLYTVDKPGYTVADIYATWRPENVPGLRLNIGVQNLFDEQYRDHSSVADYNDIPGWGGVAGLYEAGRDIRVSVGYDF